MPGHSSTAIEEKLEQQQKRGNKQITKHEYKILTQSRNSFYSSSKSFLVTETETLESTKKNFISF